MVDAQEEMADEIEAMKVKLEEEKRLAMESMEKEKETMSENLKRVELEAQTLREATDERIQLAENAAKKEKLALERKVLEEEMERFAEERANLEASVSEKRANLEHAFEEKERRFMSTCEMKVAAAKAAARASSKLLLRCSSK